LTKPRLFGLIDNYLINTARGPIVENAAIHRALSEGWIAGAALDDLKDEPANSETGVRPTRSFGFTT
jgi:phosphoglycerate dehydrogenase-like enzyme